MANFPLKTATIQKQKETKLRSRARRSQNISKFEGAGIDFKRKEKKTKQNFSTGLSLEEELERRKRGFIAYLAKGTGKWNRR